MIKKTVLILAMVAATTANAGETTSLDPFRAKADNPIEFANSNTFANIAIGRSDGRRSGITKPIEFASTIVKPEVETCKHSRCPVNIVNIS